MEIASDLAVTPPLETAAVHQRLNEALNMHIDEMIQVLIHILVVGEPYVSGFTRPFWLSHLILLRTELTHHPTRPRGVNDYERLRQSLLGLAREFWSIRRVVNSKLIPSTPELAKAIRSASAKFEHLLATIRDVQQLEQSQAQIFYWATSLVTAVGSLGKVFGTSTLYALRIWPEELDGASIGIVKRSNFPELSVGVSRRTVRIDKASEGLAPTGGVTKF